MNIEQTVRVIKLLMQSPASRMDIANKTGVAPKAVGRLLAEMKAQKMIYIIAYSNQTDGRNRVKIYDFGDGEDAKPKQTQSAQDRSRKNYLKKIEAKKIFIPMTKFVGGKSLWQ